MKIADLMKYPKELESEIKIKEITATIGYVNKPGERQGKEPGTSFFSQSCDGHDVSCDEPGEVYQGH